MLDGSAPSARGINRGGRNTPMSALAREMERARSGGVKPRAQAGGYKGAQRGCGRQRTDGGNARLASALSPPDRAGHRHRRSGERSPPRSGATGDCRGFGPDRHVELAPERP